ncbi:MAG: hypothetical protein WA101_03620 [Minisyncoccia bacterium]
MDFNFEKKFINESKIIHSPLNERLLFSEIISDTEKGLSKKTTKEAIKVLGSKEKLFELTKDLLKDEVIIRNEQLGSGENINLEKIKSDTLLEIKKKITLFIENHRNFLECQNTFSGAQNLNEFFKIEDKLKELLNKIGQYHTGSADAKRRNEGQLKLNKNKILLERPTEIFKFIIDPEYIKTKRAELHKINGIYTPNKNNPDGGDGWETKKIGNKEIDTVIDVQGHGLTQSYAKLFVEKMISLSTEDEEGLSKVDDFISKIEDTYNSQFQLKTMLIRTEVEKDHKNDLILNMIISGDTAFVIYDEGSDQIKIGGFEGMYPKGIENMEAYIEKLKPIGMGKDFNKKENFKKFIKRINLGKVNSGKKHVTLISDGARGIISKELEKEGKGNYKKYIGITNALKNGQMPDDATALEKIYY